MEDRYGRNINYMRISITDRCNLRCRYCMPEDIALVPMEKILTFEEIEMVCQAAAQVGIRRLKITGGEPLVRRGCPELVGKLKQIPGIEQVTMTTNGVLLGQYLPELLANGLDAVNVSLDTLKPQIYQQITGKDELHSVLEGIRQAVQAGISVKINVVPQKGVNDTEWLELAELARRLPVDVRFIEMMPIGYGNRYETVSNEELLSCLQKSFSGFQKDMSIHGNGPAEYYHFAGGKGSIGFISAIHGKFCKSCNRLRLSSQGKLKPCLCFGEEVDLMEVLRNGGEGQGRQERQERQEVQEGQKRQEGQKEERLKELFFQAIQKKPKEHQFDVSGKIMEGKQMVQIGG